MRPIVTVVIINYNYGRYLPEAVESVLAQDFPAGDMEVIVVDDGSTDDSKERLRPYLGRARWISKENGGQVSAFNLAFAQARGKYVALLEADDAWEPAKLRKTIGRLESEPSKTLAQHWLRCTDAEGRPLPGFSYPSGPTQVTLAQLLNGELASAGSSGLVFRADALRPDTPFPEKFLFGADICLRLAAAVRGPIAVVPEILGRRRIHGGNLFGKTLYDEPEKLARVLKFHLTMRDYHRDFLSSHGIAIDPGVLRALDLEAVQMEMFLHRYRRNFGKAIGCWWKWMRLCGSKRYAVFKGAALALALVSPALFLSAQRAYAASPLMRWRLKWSAA